MGCLGVAKTLRSPSWCVIQRARIREGRHHPPPWTGRESRVVAVKGPKPRQSLAVPEEVEEKGPKML